MKFYWEDVRDKKYRVAYDYEHQIDIKGYDIHTEFIDLSPDGILKIHKGWLYDGPSGLTYDSPSGMRGAGVHDAGYYLMRMGLLEMKYRYYFDQELHKILLEDGMESFRAGVWFTTVRVAAADYAKAGTEKPPEIFCVGKDL